MNKKKNIKIITWIGNGNYGTTLQSFSLLKKLEMMGFEVSYLEEFKEPFTFKTCIKSFLFRIGVLHIFQRKQICKSPKIIKLQKFVSEEYSKTRVYSKSDLNNVLKSTDVFITGSDQIWNAWYSFNPFCFLNFASNCKRVAYASSMGTNDFPEQYKVLIKDMLSKFSHIGVREYAAVKAITALTGRTDVVQVLDPTFLLNAQEWIEVGKLANFESKLPDSYMLCYLIGKRDNYKAQIEEVRKKYKINNIIIVPAAENLDFEVSESYRYDAAGPREFIYLIEHARLVLTDSFHATAISINLSKDFVEFLRFDDSNIESQNSRIYDLLNHYGLNNKLYSSAHDNWADTINYDEIQSILTNDRKDSIDYLTNSIER